MAEIKNMNEENMTAEPETTEDAAFYTIKLKKPVNYDGEEIGEIAFDFASLTGADAMNIDDELSAAGKFVPVAAFSTEYLIRMAAKAAKKPIGADFFKLLCLSDFEKIKARARRFLIDAD